jgi:hypothetical protein
MTPAQLATQVRNLSTDMELSGRTRDAQTLAEVAAYLVEMETHVNLIFQGGLDAIRSTSGAIVKLRAAYDKIEELQRRNETLELQIAYGRA